MNRIPWNQYFMSQSLILSTRSTCQRLMVGATIVKDNRIIAGGYNGSVPNETHCMDDGCLLEDGHCIRTIHAEMNAILQCAKLGISTENSSIYVTHFPCLTCTKAIISAGIKEIYYLNDYHNHPYAMDLIKKANIKIEKVEIPNDFFVQIQEILN